MMGLMQTTALFPGKAEDQVKMSVPRANASHRVQCEDCEEEPASHGLAVEVRQRWCSGCEGPHSGAVALTKTGAVRRRKEGGGRPLSSHKTSVETDMYMAIRCLRMGVTPEAAAPDFQQPRRPRA
jgi:hypothetical protein